MPLYLTSDTANLETRADLGRQLALGSAQDNVEELLLGRNRRDIFPRSLHDGQTILLSTVNRQEMGVDVLPEDVEENDDGAEVGRRKGEPPKVEGGQFFFLGGRDSGSPSEWQKAASESEAAAVDKAGTVDDRVCLSIRPLAGEPLQK